MKKIEQVYHVTKKVQALIYSMLLAPCFNKFGSRSRIFPPLKFSGLSQVEIGKSVFLDAGCWLITLRENKPINIPKLVIGDFTNIGMNTVISAANCVKIGSNVLLAPNVYISDHSHEYSDIKMPISLQGICNKMQVRIDSGSWIGYGACILPGASIGKNCIIGAHAIVKTTIPNYSIAVGCPAKIIKRYDEIEKKWTRVIP